jgi:cobalt-zinc-cadmium efflux system outer membrane protein
MRSLSAVAALCPLLLAAPATARDPSAEPELASTARLETIVRVALSHNRGVTEARARVLAAEARQSAAGRLPEPDLKAELWGVPLAHPLSLDRADTLMVGLRQNLPAWGTRQARGEAAAAETASAGDAARSRRQEVAVQVHRGFAAYYRASEELRLHREHVALTARVLELAGVNQRTGRGGIPEVLRLQVELTRLHADVARLERDRVSSVALLNALMDRAPDQPLGPPEPLTPPPPADLATLERRLDERPDLAAATHAARRSEAAHEEAHRAAWIPSLMLGLDYWYMPLGAETRHAYGAMMAVNLPWLGGRRRDEERAAAHTLRADQEAVAAARSTGRYELHDAAARLEAARQWFTIVDQQLVVQAGRSLEAAQAATAAGQGDPGTLIEALRADLQVRVERVQALAELATSHAELQRAAGTLATGGTP